MDNWLERTELIMSAEKMEKLHNAHVLIVGLGGIGSFAAEFIARAGVGTMTIIDGDVFDPTNKNRQLTALDSTIGRNKAVVDLPKFKFSGVFAWFVWMFVHLFSLIGFKNKAVVFLNWVYNYIRFDREARLIIRPYKKKQTASFTTDEI